MTDDSTPDPNKLARLYQIGQIGTEMAIPVGLGFAIDYFAGTLPWFTVIGALLGPALAFWHLLSILRTPISEDEKKKSPVARSPYRVITEDEEKEVHD